jgi:peptide deformylase
LIRPIITTDALIARAALRKRARPVNSVLEKAHVINVLRDLHDTLAATPHGIGLAAPQLGYSVRLIVLHFEGVRWGLVNPELKWRSDDKYTPDFREGCLSLPDKWGYVERWREVTVDFVDVDGNRCSAHAEGPLAVLLQHELDHLDGVLFTDHIRKPLIVDCG